MMSITLAGLKSAGRSPALPSLLVTPGGNILLQRWLRVLPGKRLVAAGERDGQAVVVKLFVSPAAQRHAQRELDGLLALQTAAIDTPAILDSGEFEGGGRYICTRYLEGSESLHVLWERADGPVSGDTAATELLGKAGYARPCVTAVSFR